MIDYIVNLIIFWRYILMQKVKSYISILLLIFMALSVILTGCQSQKKESANSPEVQEDNSERVIKHAMGETKIKGTPKRIIALEFSFVDSLAKLDIQPIGIADDNSSNNIIEPIRTKIGSYTSLGSRYEVNLEKISSLKPDLIIGDISRNKEIYESLSEIAPTILLDSFSAGYKESIATLPVIADAVGQGNRAAEILKAHNEIIEKYKKLVPSDEKRTVLPAVVNSKALFGHSAISFTGSLLESVGLKNGINSEKAYNEMTLEQLLKFNPDVLFIMTTGEKTIIDEWKDGPLWKELKAVQNNQVFFVDRTKWSLSRGIIAAEEILKETFDNMYPKK